MGKIHAAITGVGAYLPDYVLTNDELSRMVDTNEEWITTRVGIKERRIEKGYGTWQRPCDTDRKRPAGHQLNITKKHLSRSTQVFLFILRRRCPGPSVPCPG